MNRVVEVQSQRTLRWAESFLEEVRSDVERSTRTGDPLLLPRLRTVRERTGHATPEFRTLVIPVPSTMAGLSPEHLSASIASYAQPQEPAALILAVDAAAGAAAAGGRESILIVEARSRAGTRLVLLQPYRTAGAVVRWGEPDEGGFFDPADEEMILDGSFAALEFAAGGD